MAPLDQGKPRQRLEEALERLLRERPPQRVLDAGCGFDSSLAGFPIPPGFSRAHVVGIDISEHQVNRNRRLDEALVGDIETYPFLDETFDVIVCWDVLEHIRNPMQALRNLTRALAPGGLLVLGLPNAASLKGLITKFTPFRFHVWIYEHHLGLDAKEGSDRRPFPTYLRFSLRRTGLLRFAAEHGLHLEHEARYGQSPFLAGSSLAVMWRAAIMLMRVLSLWRIEPELSEMTFVFRKEAREKLGSGE
jgi:SAM-dependent methyltransferase